MENMRNAFKTLVGKFEGKTPPYQTLHGSSDIAIK
jgi:hypothetical protein